MDTTALRQRLGDILREEEHSNVDWETVARMCVKLGRDLDDQPSLVRPRIVFHFLSDSDIRTKDTEYGRDQRVEIRRFVETGECDDSKPVSVRRCVVALAAIAALIYLLVR